MDSTIELVTPRFYHNCLLLLLLLLLLLMKVLSLVFVCLLFWDWRFETNCLQSFLPHCGNTIWTLRHRGWVAFEFSGVMQTTILWICLQATTKTLECFGPSSDLTELLGVPSLKLLSWSPRFLQHSFKDHNKWPIVQFFYINKQQLFSFLH